MKNALKKFLPNNSAISSWCLLQNHFGWTLNSMNIITTINKLLYTEYYSRTIYTKETFTLTIKTGHRRDNKLRNNANSLSPCIIRITGWWDVKQCLFWLSFLGHKSCMWCELTITENFLQRHFYNLLLVVELLAKSREKFLQSYVPQTVTHKITISKSAKKTHVILCVSPLTTRTIHLPQDSHLSSNIFRSCLGFIVR